MPRFAVDRNCIVRYEIGQQRKPAGPGVSLLLILSVCAQRGLPISQVAQL